MKFYIILLPLLLFIQCEPPRADLSGYNQEKEKRELKKITIADRITMAHNLAISLADSLSEGLIVSNKYEIKKIEIGQKSDIEKENLIIDAYAIAAKENKAVISDNEQLIDNVFLYNRPIVDGDILRGVWSIRINYFELSK